MSQPNLAKQPQEAPTQKQKTNVYTVMLFISFVAIVTAIVLLWMELQQWGDFPWWDTEDAKVAFNLPVDESGRIV